MQFFTIGQYFNKLHIALMTIVLLSIMAFVAAYSFPGSREPETLLTIDRLAIIIVVNWILMFAYFFKKSKSIAKEQGLGLKLTKYFYLTIVRYIQISLGCFFLLFAFYLSKDDRITAVFAVNLALMGILWPGSKKVCRDLKLRGDEREMVYYKKDSF